MEFACCSVPQRCIPISMRCDGHRDCGDGDDENNCRMFRKQSLARLKNERNCNRTEFSQNFPASCSRYEFACVKSGKCIPAEKRCDGISDDCQDGTNLDELGCSRNSSE
ncbi:Low-density lipoprotein receptor domain class A [Necator americanus]|uniref:Low-density lipoprotein receptor domain class A n=1 Tax=Necator americanus TaxID=51031 RepID=W2TZP4_NECAM|nr:Low-density lipoprotein receptor domain class A [Necator americanus]ETN86546.1 Low-density lipoprotein receptor domain class A [Necator americanus]